MRRVYWTGLFASAGALALAGCATQPATQVTRFHLPQPIARGQIVVEPLLPGDRDSLEFQSYASIVGAELAKAGFTEAPGLTASEQVAIVSVERASREGPSRGSGVSIGLGLGGGSFGRGGGIGGGGGVSFPVGHPRANLIDGTRLVVQIKRRSDSTVIWEGRAETEIRSGAPGADAATTVRRLAAALFRGLPRRIRSYYHRKMTAHISAAFDAGNIRVVGQAGDRFDLEIVRDHGSDFFQWFFFRLTGAKGRNVELRILNAGGSAYPLGWPGYRARVSHDRQSWRQIETHYDAGVLTIPCLADHDTLWFAYFAPYSMERHHDLVARIAARPGVSYRSLGRTIDGQEIDYLSLGEGPRQIWLYGRQHPGETMAEWWMEGALDKLTDPHDPAARVLHREATFHVVPNMNPDGSRRGHLRTNAAGVNLNREWHAPTPERSPEVLAVRNRMEETGVDFAIDVHGDEAIPYVFLAGFEGIPSRTGRQADLYARYRETLVRRSPDFQVKHGYPASSAGTANLTMSTNQLAERFGAVSMTLEMPFKDNDDIPDADFGWSAERSMRLGADCLGALHEMIGAIGAHHSA